MTLSPTDIKHVLEALHESDWDEAVITVDDVTIAVARNGAVLETSQHAMAPQAAATPAPVAVAAPSAPQAAAPAPAPAAPAAPAEAPAAPSAPSGDEIVVTAPSVGVLWRSPQPGAPPFVEVGSKVEPGDTLCIVEVMKLMSNVVAGVAGTVTAIHVENAGQVEFGTPLISIAPSQ